MIGLTILAAATIAGAWQDVSKVDPITDVKRGIVFVDSAPDSPVKGSIILKCDILAKGPSQVYASIVSAKYLGRSDYYGRTAIWRIDDAKPVSESWSYDAETFSNMKPASFVTALAGGKRMVVRATTYESQNVDMAFDVEGAAEAIKLVYATCGDKSPIP